MNKNTKICRNNDIHELSSCHIFQQQIKTECGKYLYCNYPSSSPGMSSTEWGHDLFTDWVSTTFCSDLTVAHNLRFQTHLA